MFVHYSHSLFWSLSPCTNVSWLLNSGCVSPERVLLAVCITASQGTSRTCHLSTILSVQSRRNCTRRFSRSRIPGILSFLMTRRWTRPACGHCLHLDMKTLGHHPFRNHGVTRDPLHFQRSRNHNPRGLERSAHCPRYQNHQAQERSYTWIRPHQSQVCSYNVSTTRRLLHR